MERATNRTADLAIAAGAAHTFGADAGPARAVAIGDGEIIAIGTSLEEISGVLSRDATVVDDPELVLLPGFFDSHNHLLWTSADLPNVDISAATTVDEIVGLLRARAAETPPGEWVLAARNWHESTIRERRLPTARELDGASAEHPILVKRGGHVATANSMALRISGIADSREDPPGGTVVRDADGRPSGPLIEFPAMAPITAMLPDDDAATGLEHLARTCAEYNSRGLTAVRDPGITASDWDTYRWLHGEGRLSVRARPLFMLPAGNSADENVELLRSLEVRPGDGDDRLRATGVKIFGDGGVEGGWLREPYTNQPGYHGHAFYDRDGLEAMVEAAVRAGWRVGTHAVGDRTVELVLEVYESVQRRLGPLPPGALTIEHAFMAGAAVRKRAVAAGVRITVQHPLLYALAGNMLTHWGPERTADVMPVAEWLSDDALVAGGSDSNVTPYDPLLAIWGFVTRGTKVAGIQGPEHAVDRRTAFSLYTEAGWRLLDEGHVRGRLEPGYSADLVAFRQDPLTVDIDDLPTLSPAFTLVGGRPVFDPEGVFAVR